MQQRKARLADRLQFKAWKRGRAVEGTGLENRRRGNPFVSSNLTASARTLRNARYGETFMPSTHRTTHHSLPRRGASCVVVDSECVGAILSAATAGMFIYMRHLVTYTHDCRSE